MSEPTGPGLDGPCFEDLAVGDRFDDVPALTLTDGHAALHQAVLGSRLRLALDRPLAERVLGPGPPLAHPALVCDVAIGQSTLATRNVVANLFYRGLQLARAPRLGDTLRTTTEVVALKQNRRRPGRRPTGLAVLRIETVDQLDRPVLGFWRCAMLPLRDAGAATGRDDDVDRIPSALDPTALHAATAGWSLDGWRRTLPGRRATTAGARWQVGGDVVTSAPELARLTLNVASVHHDAAAAGGRRLVYGGHTIGLAAAHATRALPDLLTIVGWHRCDHLAPVHEGDTLTTELTLERVDRPPLSAPAAASLAHLRAVVRATPAERNPVSATDVLDWRFVAALA
jgi:acyl dehydratase